MKRPMEIFHDQPPEDQKFYVGMVTAALVTAALFLGAL